MGGKMNKAKRAVLIFVVVSLVIILSLFTILKYAKPTGEVVYENLTYGGIIFYYGAECPHCANVEKYIEENNVDSKIDIIKKEVYHDKNNALELQQTAKKCKINSNEIGVPLIYSEGRCYIGDVDGINFLKTKIEEIK